MIKEKSNGLFLWRASLGDHHRRWVSPLNIDLLDNREHRIMEDRDKIARHDKKRGQFLRYGLQQVLYIKKVFELSTTELIELVLREDQKMDNFPDYSREEIYDVMIDKCCCLCKMAKLEGKAKSRA